MLKYTATACCRKTAAARPHRHASGVDNAPTDAATQEAPQTYWRLKCVVAFTVHSLLLTEGRTLEPYNEIWQYACPPPYHQFQYHLPLFVHAFEVVYLFRISDNNCMSVSHHRMFRMSQPCRPREFTHNLVNCANKAPSRPSCCYVPSLTPNKLRNTLLQTENTKIFFTSLKGFLNTIHNLRLTAGQGLLFTLTVHTQTDTQRSFGGFKTYREKKTS